MPILTPCARAHIRSSDIITSEDMMTTMPCCPMAPEIRLKPTRFLGAESPHATRRNSNRSLDERGGHDMTGLISPEGMLHTYTATLQQAPGIVHGSGARRHVRKMPRRPRHFLKCGSLNWSPMMTHRAVFGFMLDDSLRALDGNRGAHLFSRRTPADENCSMLLDAFFDDDRRARMPGATPLNAYFRRLSHRLHFFLHAGGRRCQSPAAPSCPPAPPLKRYHAS